MTLEERWILLRDMLRANGVSFRYDGTEERMIFMAGALAFRESLGDRATDLSQLNREIDDFVVGCLHGMLGGDPDDATRH